MYDEKLNAHYKLPTNLFVQDVLDDNIVWTRITRVLKHPNDKKMRFIKLSNGLSIITTEDHPWITQNGDIEARNITSKDYIKTYNYIYFTNKINNINDIILDNDLGWLTGMILSEGINKPSQLTICQKENSEQYNRIIEILKAKQIPYSTCSKDRINILSCPYQKYILSFLVNKTSANKKLPSNFFEYDYNFLNGIIAGLIDGDGTLDGYKSRHCQIRITSRELLNQISLYLQFNNIFVGDRTPYIHQNIHSFKSNLTMYGIGFTLTNEKYFSSINSIKIKNRYIPTIRKGNFKNKIYNYNYGSNNCLENSEFIENVDIVYDLTTESGHFLCNNILSHNCFAYDIDRLAKEGLYFIDNFNAEPPKHLVTFTDFVGEFVSYCCNRSSGAVGLPSFLIYSYYFWKKDVDEGYVVDGERYAKQEYQRIIYKLNQPYLRGGIQSAFTNFSIFDHEYLIALFGGKTFPDGRPIIAEIDDIIEYEKMFMEVLSEIRMHNMMTYPVMSISLLRKDGKFVDEEFARWANRHNMKWGDSNFFVSEDVTSLSNCCRLISDVKELG